MLVRLISSSFAPTEAGISLFVKRFRTKFTLVVWSANFFRFFFEPVNLHCQLTNLFRILCFLFAFFGKLFLEIFFTLVIEYSRSIIQKFFLPIAKQVWLDIIFSCQGVEIFSPLSSSITRSDLNLALKFLLCLDIIMNPLFHTEFSISDSLKNVRKSVLIYETIILFYERPYYKCV